jgi:hypothetical protein
VICAYHSWPCFLSTSALDPSLRAAAIAPASNTDQGRAVGGTVHQWTSRSFPRAVTEAKGGSRSCGPEPNPVQV